jgi:two-component sensor histidine kinase
MKGSPSQSILDQRPKTASATSNDPILTRAELEELHTRYREIKHAINNTFAVIMALSELAQRNPANYEKLAKAVLERSPTVVNQLAGFGDELGAKLKERPAA